MFCAAASAPAPAVHDHVPNRSSLVRRAGLRDRLLPLLEELGRSAAPASATPVNVPIVVGSAGGRGWVQPRHLPAVVVAGRMHSVLLTAAGTAWAVGSGLFGRLGLGNEGDAEVPALVPALAHTRVVSVRAARPSPSLSPSLPLSLPPPPRPTSHSSVFPGPQRPPACLLEHKVAWQQASASVGAVRCILVRALAVSAGKLLDGPHAVPDSGWRGKLRSRRGWRGWGASLA